MISRTIQKIRSLRHLDCFVVLSFVIGVFSFLYFSGTLNSGYHFIDDHGMIGIRNSLTAISFRKTVFVFTKNDFLIRFRPIFYPYQVSMVKVFGLNLLNMSIFVGLLASMTISFFYLGMRKMKHSIFVSIVSVFLIFGGSQMAIWWRLGTNETIAIFFLGLSFLYLAKCSKPRNYILNNGLFNTFIIISALSKESFLIVVPAFAVLKVWNEKNTYQITWQESLKKNWLLIFPFLTMFAGLLIIKFYVGTNKIGYAGVTSSIREFLSGVKHIVLGPTSLLNWVILLAVLTVMYLATFLPLKKDWKKEFIASVFDLLPYVVFTAVLVVPEVLMHAKSGMVERYLLPTTFGLAFLAIGLLQAIKGVKAKYLAVLAISIFILLSLNISITNAKAFAAEGRDAGGFFFAIKENAKPNSSILLVADPVDRFEVSDSIKIYLSAYGYNSFYAYPLMLEAHSTDFDLSLEKQWEEWFVGKKIENIGGRPDLVIVFDKVQSEVFFSQSGLLQSDYVSVLPDSSGHALFKRVK